MDCRSTLLTGSLLDDQNTMSKDFQPGSDNIGVVYIDELTIQGDKIIFLCNTKKFSHGEPRASLRTKLSF